MTFPRSDIRQIVIEPGSKSLEFKSCWGSGLARWDPGPPINPLDHSYHSPMNKPSNPFYIHRGSSIYPCTRNLSYQPETFPTSPSQLSLGSRLCSCLPSCLAGIRKRAGMLRGHLLSSYCAGSEPTAEHRCSHLICLMSLGSRYSYCPHSTKETGTWRSECPGE